MYKQNSVYDVKHNQPTNQPTKTTYFYLHYLIYNETLLLCSHLLSFVSFNIKPDVRSTQCESTLEFRQNRLIEYLKKKIHVIF